MAIETQEDGRRFRLRRKLLPHLPRVGLRNLKTALAATLCAILYAIVGRNPTFACIGAIFGMGADMNDSWESGANRLIGTVLGGVLGLGLFWVYLQLPHPVAQKWAILPLLFLGIVVLIFCGQLFRWPGAIRPGGVVLCIILFNTPDQGYVSYALQRMVDTGVGVLVALAVNLLLSRERLDRWRGRDGMEASEESGGVS